MANYNEFRGHFFFPKGEGRKVYDDLVAEVVRRKNEVFDVCTRVNMALRAMPADTTPEGLAGVVREIAGKDARKCWLNVVLGDDLYYQRGKVTDFAPGDQLPEAARLVALKCKPAMIPEPRPDSLFFPTPEQLHLNAEVLTRGAGDEWGNWAATFSSDFNRLSLHCEKNNHAVESVQRSPLFQHLMERLDRVPWTDKTGGYLDYSDEYSGGWRLLLRKGQKPEMKDSAPAVSMGM